MAESLLNPQRVELSNNPVTLARHFGVFRSPTKLEINYFCFQSEFAAALPQSERIEGRGRKERRITPVFELLVISQFNKQIVH